MRGSFKYNHNHFPIQNFYVQEVVKDAAGDYTMKTLDVALRDHKDRFAVKCEMNW